MTNLFHESVGSGPPLVVLHGGMGLDHTYFRPWLDSCGDFARVVYFDFSGNGRSRANGAEDLGHERWVQDVEDVRQALGLGPITLLGHSYGGFVAQEYVLAYPQSVEKLILSNTAPILDYPEVMIENAESRGTPSQVQRVLEMFSAPTETDRAMEEAFGDILPLYFHRWNESLVRDLTKDIEYSVAAFNQGNFVDMLAFDTRDRLAEIACPTLVISGASDWIMPPEHGGERLHEGIRDSHHVVFEESGHFPFAEEPERFVDVLRSWMSETARDTG